MRRFVIFTQLMGGPGRGHAADQAHQGCSILRVVTSALRPTPTPSARRTGSAVLLGICLLAAACGGSTSSAEPTEPTIDDPVATSSTTAASTASTDGADTTDEQPAALPTPDYPDRAEPGATNVVVIMTDDQTVEQMRWLPSIGEYFAAGTTYANSITNYPLCGPSRVTFLTGQHATNHDMPCNPGLATRFHRNREPDSLAPWLQAAGVHTIHVGKYLNGWGGKSDTRYTPAGWDDWRALAGASAYKYTRFDMVVNGEWTRYGRQGQTAYSTDVLADHLVDALGAAPADRPFFAVFTPLAPHFEAGEAFAIPAPRHDGLVDDVLRPDNFDSCQAREASCPDPGSDLFRDPLTSDELDVIDNAYQTTAESLFAVDEAFRRITHTLDDLGRLNDTVIVFTSDNGFAYGEHGIDRGKRVPTREALFVPLLITGPGFATGTSVTQPVGNIDLAPTIVDLFDAEPTTPMDGQSLLDPLTDDRALLIEAKPQDGTRGYDGVYADGWLFIDWVELDRNDLYGPDDPGQTTTLDADPAWDAIEAELAELTATLKACSGPTCRLSWQTP
jgi:arylsulfatase A-like enzyme